MRLLLACLMTSACLIGCAPRGGDIKVYKVHTPDYRDSGTDDRCGLGSGTCPILVFVRPAQTAKISIDGLDHPHCYAYVQYKTTLVTEAETTHFLWQLHYDGPTGQFMFDEKDAVHLKNTDGYDAPEHIHLGPKRQQYRWRIKHEHEASSDYYFSISEYDKGGNLKDTCEQGDPTIANN